MLVNAVIRGELPDVRRALATGADPGTIADLALRTAEPGKRGQHRTDGTTPLMRAANLGHADIVLCLVEARAGLEDRDSRGWTPICHALGAAEIEIARSIQSQFTPEQIIRQRKVVRDCKPDLLDRCAAEVGDASVEHVRLELEAIVEGRVAASTGSTAGGIFGGKMLAKDRVNPGPDSAMILPSAADRSLQTKAVDSAEDTDSFAAADTDLLAAGTIGNADSDLSASSPVA